MKSLLLIAYKFPPMQSVSCNRTWAIYNGMHKYFDHVHVITTSNRHILPQDDIDTSAAQITDAKTIDYRTLFQRAGKTSVAGEHAKTSMFGKVAMKLQSSFPTLRLFGEGGLLYIKNAVNAAEKMLKRHPITHVFSTYSPYADHLIALRLKRAHPELFWIADFRDLHVDPAQDNLYWRKYQQDVNQKILKHANLVTTVSEGLAEHLRSFHPNVQVLPNGIREQSGKTQDLFPKFTIAYTGSMFQDKRRHDTLIEAIANLIRKGVFSSTDIELVYAGKDSNVWWPVIRQHQLEHIFRDHGLVSRRDAEIIQQRSHLNILLTYSTEALKGNLTGKLYDYLSAQRPLLVLINGPADPEIEKIITQTGAGVVAYHGDLDTVTRYITSAYETWKQTGAFAHAYHEDALSALRWNQILERFAEQNGLKSTMTHA